MLGEQCGAATNLPPSWSCTIGRGADARGACVLLPALCPSGTDTSPFAHQLHAVVGLCCTQHPSLHYAKQPHKTQPLMPAPTPHPSFCTPTNPSRPPNKSPWPPPRPCHLVTLRQQLLRIVLRHHRLEHLIADGGQHALVPVHAQVLRGADEELNRFGNTSCSVLHNESGTMLVGGSGQVPAAA